LYSQEVQNKIAPCNESKRNNVHKPTSGYWLQKQMEVKVGFWVKDLRS